MATTVAGPEDKTSPNALDTPVRAADEKHSENSLTQSDDHDHHNHSDLEAGGKADLTPVATNTNKGLALEQTKSRQRYSKIGWALSCASLYLAAFIYGLDNTIVADIQSAAVETFGSVSKLAWLGTGFPLGSIAVIAGVGKAFAQFDSKWLFNLGLLMFLAGSALCGGAPNMDALIVARVWAGVGGAAAYLGAMNIISANTTIQERPIYFAGIGFVWGVGNILGPVIGGSFADSSATWRWAFYLNLVLFGVFSPIYIFLLKSNDPAPNKSILAKFKSIDWIGIVLNIGMYVSFVMAFTFGGTEWAWSSGRSIALIVVFGVLFILFALQQTFCIGTSAEHRIFPIDFLRSRTLILQYICQSAVSTGLFVPVYYIPLFFAFTRGDSNIDAAVRLLPFIIITIFFIMVNGALMPKFGYYMPWQLASGVFLLIGGALLYSLVNPNTSNSAVYGYSVLAAIGAGASQQAAFSVVQAKVPPERIPDAVGFITSAQIGSVVISLTITGAVFQNIGFAHVSSVLGSTYSRQEIQGALAGAKSSIFEEISGSTRDQVIAGIVRAIDDGFILVITAGAVLIVASLLMRREKLFMEVAAGG